LRKYERDKKCLEFQFISDSAPISAVISAVQGKKKEKKRKRKKNKILGAIYAHLPVLPARIVR